jgi:hypothetical protein
MSDLSLPVSLGDPAGVSALAEAMVDMSAGFIQTLGLTANSLVAPVISPNFPGPDAAPAQVVPAPPTAQPVVFSTPNAPPAFSGVLDISTLLPAPFDAEPPTLMFGSAPAPFVLAAPTSPGVQTNFDFPTLDLNLPTPPNLLSIQTFPFDGVTMPSIDPTVPVLNIAVPNQVIFQEGSPYCSTLLSTLRNTLNAIIETGGNILGANIEAGIYGRDLDRRARAQADAVLGLEQMESLGYAFAPGVYLDSRLKILTETEYTSEGFSVEVANNQAKLQQETLFKAIEDANTLEIKNLDINNEVEQRLFESCKYRTEAAISIYNSQVEGYKATVQAYQLKIQIYDEQIKLQLALVDVYKTEIQAEQIKAEINTALVEQYKAETEAALATVEVYKAQIQGIQVQAEIQKLVIEIFGEQVRAYAAQVSAYSAQVEAYHINTQAQGVIEDTYKTQVDAFGVQVTAATKEIEARIREYEAQIELYKAQYDAYKDTWQASAAQAQAITASNLSQTDAYKAQIASSTAYNELLTKQWQVALDQAERVAEIGINAAKMNADLYITTRSLALDAAKVGAQVGAQLGAAAINAINWSTSVSLGASNSTSTSTNTSTITSFSESVSAGVSGG